ncbi:hypothetical protein TNIN_231471 [Trichonephila inaurata madagascariensis]|uniref:Uncharacterized protein n=1 Tax=Trichonephila inaurata madagascariensis TaxID=2747483 RepID=A0A8X7CJ23_9ARAC|nr:hypothetical protein TNIN_231471 [Trichonephila inaurata madagascariensis]
MKKEIQIEEYKIVRSLLVETDEAAFDLRLKEALKIFDEIDDTKEFNFEQTYDNKVCVSLMERSHKRFDEELFNLMKFERGRVSLIYFIGETHWRLISLVSSKIAQLRK